VGHDGAGNVITSFSMRAKLERRESGRLNQATAPLGAASSDNRRVLTATYPRGCNRVSTDGVSGCGIFSAHRDIRGNCHIFLFRGAQVDTKNTDGFGEEKAAGGMRAEMYSCVDRFYTFRERGGGRGGVY
jgi:hypothetical protein